MPLAERVATTGIAPPPVSPSSIPTALRHDPIADAVLAHTTCGPADLTGCADALTKLGTGGRPSTTALPDPGALQAGTDPDWAATTFGGAKVDFLLP